MIFPGFDGGAEWGGSAVDTQNGNSLRECKRNGLDRSAGAGNTAENSPKALYMSQCGVCHGEKMTGSPPAIPSLVGVGDRLSPQQIGATIKSGKGRMPAFANFDDDQLYALIDFLVSGKSKELPSSEPTPPDDEISVYGLPQISGSRWLSCLRSAMGYAQRNQSQHR